MGVGVLTASAGSLASGIRKSGFTVNNRASLNHLDGALTHTSDALFYLSYAGLLVLFFMRMRGSVGDEKKKGDYAELPSTAEDEAEELNPYEHL